MVSAVDLCWGDYAGSYPVPKHHHKGYWRWSTIPHSAIWMNWTDEYLTAACLIVGSISKAVWDHFNASNRQKGSANAKVSNLRPSLAFTEHSCYQHVYVENLTGSHHRIVCRVSEERRQSIQDWLSLLSTDPPRLCHVKSFSLPRMFLLSVPSCCLLACNTYPESYKKSPEVFSIAR